MVWPGNRVGTRPGRRVRWCCTRRRPTRSCPRSNRSRPGRTYRPRTCRSRKHEWSRPPDTCHGKSCGGSAPPSGDRLDTDGPEPAEDKAAAKEALWLKAASKGVRFGGFLANENAELLQTLIEAGAGPRKTPDGQRDPRSRTKRQADALTAILNAAAGSGNAAPGHGGIAPHLNLTMDFFDLQKAGAD